MTIINEDFFVRGEFEPFDDSQAFDIPPPNFEISGIDTSEIDAFRQGVEIQTIKQRFAGMQPKIWVGNNKHWAAPMAIGSPRDFTQYENSSIFLELPKFDPVMYIELGFAYPLPIVFNNGPQEEEQSSVEPITIPFRKPSIEGKFNAKRILAYLANGNNFQTFERSSTETLQFYPYHKDELRFFLDEGTDYFGLGSQEDKIIIDGYISLDEMSAAPFDDTLNLSLLKQVNTTDQTFINILQQMKINLDLDLRPNDSFSSTAGYMFYGGDSAKVGTDSISFLWRYRGY